MKRMALLTLGVIALGSVTTVTAQDSETAPSWAYIAGINERVVVQDFAVERDTLWVVTPTEFIALMAKANVGHKPVVWQGPPNWSVLVLAVGESTLSAMGPSETTSASASSKMQRAIESALRRYKAPFQWVKATSAGQLEVLWTGTTQPEKFSIMSGYPTADEILQGQCQHLRVMQQHGRGFVITANSTSYPSVEDASGAEAEFTELLHGRMWAEEARRLFAATWNGRFITRPAARCFLNPPMVVRRPR